MFALYWFSFNFGYWVTLSVAVPFGLFSAIQIVISLEQMLRYMNRAHSEKILVGTSFYLMFMHMLRSGIKLISEYIIGPEKDKQGLYIVCLIVQGTLILTSFSAYAINQWLYTRSINLDRSDAVPNVMRTNTQGMQVTNYGEDLEVEIY